MKNCFNIVVMFSHADEQSLFMSDKLCCLTFVSFVFHMFIFCVCVKLLKSRRPRVLKIRRGAKEAAGCFTPTSLMKRQEAAAASDLSEHQPAGTKRSLQLF